MGAPTPQSRQQWRACLLLSLAVHAAVLSIVFEKHPPADFSPYRILSLRLLAPRALAPGEAESPGPSFNPVVEDPAETVRPDSPATVLSKVSPGLIQPEAVEPQADEAIDDPKLLRRILSSQYGLDSDSDRKWLSRVDAAKAPDPDAFLHPQQRSMEMALNTPSIQLPFEDRRIYLIESYSAGINGSIERFWDRVTLPFGWTTEHGTHFECAWVLIIGGCAWGPNVMFQHKAKRREKES